MIRIDGRLDEARIPALLDQVMARIEPVSAALAGVEIDYDCPTSKLATYARFLAALRSRLAPSLKLSITALPTWMTSSRARAADPRSRRDRPAGPCRGRSAPRPVRSGPGRALGARLRPAHPPAFPCGASRLRRARDLAVRRAAGERRRRDAPARRRDERRAARAPRPRRSCNSCTPCTIGAPEGLVGIAWFRLPTDADSRAWSLQTWRAVIAGELPAARLSAGLVPAERADLWTVTLSNDGPVDAALPRQVRLDPACEAADGANGFRLAAAGGPLVLEATGGGRLRANRKRIIGWARCTEPERMLDVVQ